MFWLLAILAYLLGSLSFAILLSRLTGNPDPRMSGSGNAGATNMLRLAGKKLADPDPARRSAARPAAGADRLGAGLSLQDQAWIGVCAVIGHLFPLYFRFRGGKGVATAAGMLLGLYPPAALLAVCAWLLTFYLTRTSSLAALDRHPTDPAIAGLARAGGAAAHERADGADRLASSRQSTRPVCRARTAFLNAARQRHSSQR